MTNTSSAYDRFDESEQSFLLALQRGDARAFERLMRACNRKLFRIARSILKNDTEAEEALQEAYVTAFRAVKSFRGEAKLSTWLSRIVINEALGRLRKAKREEVVIPYSSELRERSADDVGSIADPTTSSPEEAALRSQLRALLERRIDALPAAFRTVFMMREVEDMTVEETAEALGIPQATVRTRLFRARALLRTQLANDLDVAVPDAFSFDGERCDRIVAAVLARIR